MRQPTPTRAALLCVAASLLLAGAAHADPPEAPMPPRPTDAVQRWTHASGATAYLVEKHDFSYVTFTVSLRSGALWDPLDKPGLATLTGELMMRGAGDRDRAQLAEDLEVLGTELEVGVGKTTITFDGDALSRNLDPIVALVADILQRPTLSQDEFDRLKREHRSTILQSRDDDRALARRFFDRYLYGLHPYGLPSDGTLEGLEAITLDDVRAFYAAHVRADNVIVGFAGDVTRDRADALLAQLVGALPNGRPVVPQATAPVEPKGRQVLLVDKPDRTQNQIVVGHFAPTAEHPDHYALDVVNTLYGGTFTARLNHEIREKRGLSYGAYSAFSTSALAGTFFQWTYPAAEDGMKTTRLLLDLFTQLRDTPLTDKQVAFGRDFLINSFAFRIDTPDKLLTEAIRADLQGLPPDYLDTYVERIKAVTPAQANAAIQRWLDPDNLLLVMLCTAAGFEEPMGALPGVTTVKVVPYDASF